MFIWDGPDTILELNGSSVVTSKYYRGLNLVASEIGNSGLRYYLFNAHGDVVHLLDSSGTVVKDYSYDATIREGIV